MVSDKDLLSSESTRMEGDSIITEQGNKSKDKHEGNAEDKMFDLLEKIDLKKLFSSLLGGGTNGYSLPNSDQQSDQMQLSSDYPSAGGRVNNIFNISPVMTNTIGRAAQGNQLAIDTSDDPNVPPKIKLKGVNMEQIAPRFNPIVEHAYKKVDRQMHRLQGQVDGLHVMKDNLEKELEFLRSLAKQERDQLNILQRNATTDFPVPSSVILNNRQRRI